jgi:hypothetical protein
LLSIGRDQNLGGKAPEDYQDYYDTNGYFGAGYCTLDAFELLYFSSFAIVLFRTLIDDSNYWHKKMSVPRTRTPLPGGSLLPQVPEEAPTVAMLQDGFVGTGTGHSSSSAVQSLLSHSSLESSRVSLLDESSIRDIAEMDNHHIPSHELQVRTT